VLLEDAGLSLDDRPEGLGTTLGKALLEVHRCYLGAVLPLVRDHLVSGICHVTGGGIPGNLVRILPAGCGAEIAENWPVPPVFGLIERLGRVPREEMRRAFNMGAGMLLAVSARNADAVMERLAPHSPFTAGRTVRGGSVEYA
jgi:phosphoribosylformylglycinamidine cyclo-ligase